MEDQPYPIEFYETKTNFFHKENLQDAAAMWMIITYVNAVRSPERERIYITNQNKLARNQNPLKGGHVFELTKWP